MMKKTLASLSIFVFLTLGVTGTILAQQQPAMTPAQGQQPAIPGATNTAQTSGFKIDVGLKNPLKVDTIQEAIKFFVNTLVKIAIPFIVVFFIWSGLQFILAQGNPEKLKKAKQMFWYTIIGTLLILGAWTITNAIIGTVNTIIG